LGFCNVSRAQLAEALAVGPVDAVQVPYCLFIRGVEQELLPFCREKGVGVMAYGALGHGILGGKMTPQTKFEDSDWRSGKVFGVAHWQDQEGLFAPGKFERNLAKVERLKEIAARSGYTVAQLALAWTLANPAISVSLAGVKRPSQLADNAGAGE
ncbi:MAG TPA: aldo/keto reductase, partial [Armatimonadota bacterium]|nr:aldo/keto reductase [Armatimonadota bacterium]